MEEKATPVTIVELKNHIFGLYVLKNFRESYSTNTSDLFTKIASIFSCEKCNYRCRKESDYKKHLLTRKHLKETNGNIGNIKETKKVAIHQCSDCMRSFASRAGLWKHKQKCCGGDIDVDNNLDDLVATYTKDKEVEFKELILLLLKENKEIQKNFMDMIPHIKGHAEHSFNTTTTNSHNTNNFNIQIIDITGKVILSKMHNKNSAIPKPIPLAPPVIKTVFAMFIFLKNY